MGKHNLLRCRDVCGDCRERVQHRGVAKRPGGVRGGLVSYDAVEHVPKANNKDREEQKRAKVYILALRVHELCLGHPDRLVAQRERLAELIGGGDIAGSIRLRSYGPT